MAPTKADPLALVPRASAGPVPCLPPGGGRYHIETWGCQMNVHDSEKLAGSLEREGWRRAAGVADADVVLLNTCSIREKAEDKLFDELGRLRELKAERPELVLGVCGCVAQQEGERIFERAPHVDFVVGPRSMGTVPGTVAAIRRGDPTAGRRSDCEHRDDSVLFPYEDIRRLSRGKAFVTLVEGCNHRCTYCIVPTTRGREISRDMETVIAEVRHLVERGVQEVEYLGQTVNAYRDGRGRDLADVLRATARRTDVRRVRFTTSHPAQMTDRLIDAMSAAAPPVMPYLHLPVQSGSDAVLAAMRRGYDRRRYVERVRRLRNALPEIALGTDVIVGFPTEGADDFEATLGLLREIEFDTVYSFAYSPRPGTRAAAEHDAVSPEEKRARLHRLQALQHGIQERRAGRWVGATLDVLVEGRSPRNAERWTGRTPHHAVVNFDGPAEPGRLVPVRVTAATAYSLRGVAAEAGERAAAG